MAADLHIHIFEGITEKDLKVFFSNSLGSKYFSFYAPTISYKEKDEISVKIGKTSNIHIGSVSWLKALFSKDEEASNLFIPQTVGIVYDLIGEDLPILTDELIEKIVNAFNMSNKTEYRLNDKEKVKEFLEKHKGKRVFTVSW